MPEAIELLIARLNIEIEDSRKPHAPIKMVVLSTTDAIILRDELTRLRVENARLRKIEQSHHNLCEMIDGMTKSEAYRAALAGKEKQQ